MIVVFWMLLIAGTMWKGYKYPPGGVNVPSTVFSLPTLKCIPRDKWTKHQNPTLETNTLFLLSYCSIPTSILIHYLLRVERVPSFMWSFIHLFLRVFTFFKFFSVSQKNWRYKDISGPDSKLSDSADLVSCSWDTLYVQPSIPLSPHQQPTLNCPSSGKHWSVKRFWWQMSLSSLLLLRPWMFIFSLPLVSSHTAKPLWQLGLEALGETELDTATPACPWGQLSQPHTLASTRQDPPDILFSSQIPVEISKDDPGEVMQLWSFPDQLYCSCWFHIK